MTEARVKNLAREHLGALVDLAGQQQQLQQCSAGYYKLPVVPKVLYRGERGGLFYVNQKGRQVYLNARQKQELQNQTLPGVVLAQPLVAGVGENPRAVFTRVERRLAAARRS